MLAFFSQQMAMEFHLGGMNLMQGITARKKKHEKKERKFTAEKKKKRTLCFKQFNSWPHTHEEEKGKVKNTNFLVPFHVNFFVNFPPNLLLRVFAIRGCAIRAPSSQLCVSFSCFTSFMHV